jgi:type II secretory pathway component PulF
MALKRFSPHAAADFIWICRRLAGALQAGATLSPALDAAAQRAPARLRPLVDALRRRVARGGRLSDEIREQGAPSYVWEAVSRGEAGATLPAALALLADRLELEQGIAAPRDPKLHAYALAFGRMGMLVALRVPFLTVLEAAAESVAPSAATDALMAARKGVSEGDSFSDALERAGPDVPRMTIEMIRDGENDRRVGEALAVIADYLLDEEQPTKSLSKER